MGHCPVCLLRLALPGKSGDGESAPRVEAELKYFGDYELLEEVATGGQGVVYRARQLALDRLVALKLPNVTRAASPEFLERFRREGEVAASLEHPNIVPLYEAGECEGRPYLAMKWVEGEHLGQWIKRERDSAPEKRTHQFGERWERIARLMIKVAGAIHYAHQHGVLHRDVKPGNILVDRQGEPFLTDFGLAKVLELEGNLTQTISVLGTPNYLAPELASGGARLSTVATDVYGLGAILYQLLTGQPPFAANSPLDALRLVLDSEPIRPRAMDAEIRIDLEAICLKALSRSPKDRYASAEAMAEDLTRFVRREPVLARPVTRRQRLIRWAERNPILAAMVAGLCLVLVLGTAVSTWQSIVATRARSTADAERLRAERQLYAANMNLAQREWEQNNAGRVRQLLDETAAHPERGFEWYYWQRQTHRELMTLRGHDDVFGHVAFSQDGRRIVTGSRDLTAKIWDAGSGKELLTLRGHTAGIIGVAFSPDSQRIVTGSGDATAKVWEAATGKELLTLTGHVAGIWGVAFSPDGQRIATGSWDHTAKVWDAATGKELLPLRGHSNQVFSVAFSPDSQRIVTGSWDRTAKVWDAANGRELLNLNGHTDPIRSVAFSPDGQRIVTGSHDKTAKVWDAASGKELVTLRGHSGMIRPATFSPDGQWIVTGSADQTAKVWKAASGRELLTLRGHTAGIRGVAFSPDGQRIVTGSEDGTAKVWEAKDRFTLRGHSDVILSVAFSPDGQRIVTGSLDQTAKVWEVASGKHLLTLERHAGGIRSVAFSPDGQRIVTGSWDQTAKVWDAAGGRQLLLLEGHHGGIRSVAFSQDGQRIVTGSEDKTAMLWEADSGKQLRTLSGHTGGVRSVTFSPDGQRIATGSEDQTAKVWEVASGSELYSLTGHIAAVNTVAFSPDGQQIATGSGDQSASQRSGTRSEESLAILWEVANGRRLLTLKGHSAAITSVAFSPDGQRIITGSGDQTAKLWEVASASELLTLKGHNDAISSVAFSRDGQRIVTGSWDMTARVWEAATAPQVATWLREGKNATEHLALLRREQLEEAEKNRPSRASDSGAIKQWLVLAPIRFEAPSGAVALAQEQIAHEAQLRPRAGDRVKVGENELIWSEVQLRDSLLDFTQLLGGPGNSSVAYAVCYLQAEAHQAGLLLEVSRMDVAMIYLNGNETYRHTWPHGLPRRPDSVEGVELNAGINVLVFKVLVEIGPSWEGSVWLSDATGQPPKGLRVTLDPESKD